LLKALNEALEKTRAAGILDSLNNHWLGG
jgi:ABC-type amino acid transport substrate-binding protein